MDLFIVARIISLVMKVSNSPQKSVLNNYSKFFDDHIREVEEIGYTVIPPKKVASNKTRKIILETILKIAEKKTGNTLNLNANTNAGRYKAIPQTDSQFILYSLLFEDPIFEEWLMNDAISVMSAHFLNDQAQLSSMSSFIKWKGCNYKSSLGLHADTQPSPINTLPTEWADACNSVYCLTDYTLKDGALAVVPRSHKLGRPPTLADDFNDSNIIPVEAPAGSLIFWHGNLWHGAYPKLTDGLRVNLTTFMTHRRLKTQECIKTKLDKQMLDRNPSKKFARLVGLNDSNGFDEEGPDMSGIIDYGTKDQKQRFTFNVEDL